MQRAIILSALFAGVSMAQIVTGSIVGSATYASGAIVPRVSISVTNLQTGVSRAISTDESGNFSAPQLPPGVYRVTATAEGFKRYEVNEVTLLVDHGACGRAP
jgi:hypothetical protein